MSNLEERIKMSLIDRNPQQFELNQQMAKEIFAICNDYPQQNFLFYGYNGYIWRTRTDPTKELLFNITHVIKLYTPHCFKEEPVLRPSWKIKYLKHNVFSSTPSHMAIIVFDISTNRGEPILLPKKAAANIAILMNNEYKRNHHKNFMIIINDVADWSLTQVKEHIPMSILNECQPVYIHDIDY